MWWRQRRPEIVEDFDREIYGRVPANTPKVNWEVTSITRETNGTVPVITKKLAGHVDNSSDTNITVTIDLTLSTPANATSPVPVMMQFGFNFPPGFFARFRGTNAPGGTNGPGRGGFGGDSGPTWQQQVLAKGWGYAILTPTSFQADNGAGLTQGIIGLMNQGQPRKPDDWGALRAWAWGASRALDYFETDKAVDAKRVGIEGHSRYGKATLVAMAYDPRFAIAYVSSSGEGGAKLHRRNWGEMVENLAGSGEYHWMAGNFIKYAGPLNWNDLPVDAHELIALCAPRPVFISGGVDTRRRLGGCQRHVHGRRRRRAGLHAARKKRSGNDQFPADRNRVDGRRHCLSPAQRRTYGCPELAGVFELRQPVFRTDPSQAGTLGFRRTIHDTRRNRNLLERPAQSKVGGLLLLQGRSASDCAEAPEVDGLDD